MTYKVAQTSVCDPPPSESTQTEVCATELLRRYIATQIKQQISRRRFDSELTNHAHDLATVHGGMVRDVSHLIDETHRSRIAAEQIEGPISRQLVFIQG